MSKKNLVVEFVGISCSGKTTVKNNLFEEDFINKNFIDHDKVGVSNNRKIIKPFTFLLANIKLGITHTKIMSYILYLLIKNYRFKTKELIHRYATFVIVLDKIQRNKNKKIIFCEAILKSLSSIRSYSKAKDDKILKKILNIYLNDYNTIFIYFDTNPEKALKRIKQRLRDSDKRLLSDKNPLERLNRGKIDQEEVLNMLNEKEVNIYNIKEELNLSEKVTFIVNILKKYY